MKILCTNFHASIIKCTNLMVFAAKLPDYAESLHQESKIKKVQSVPY